MAKQDDFIRTALRVPPDLHARIHAAADAAGRTFNAEIVRRLTESFERARPEPRGIEMSMEDIHRRCVARLRNAKQEAADARAELNSLMFEILNGGEEARARSTLRDLMSAENERLRSLEREIAELEDQLEYVEPTPTEEQIEAHFKQVDAMREAEGEPTMDSVKK